MKDVVVVVGGDTERGLLLRDKLAIEQRRVKLCQSLREFFATISEETVDAIFLLFPDEFGVVSKLFDEGIMSCFAGNVPVVFISASPNENNMARASYYKADEFLIEPVSIDEITKIIDDAIKLRFQSEHNHIVTAGDIVLNKETLVVTCRNKRIRLYPTQVRLLEFLMLNPRRPITRMELLNKVWHTDVYIEDRTIDQNIKRIREAFKRKVKRDPIRTIFRVGYLFNDQF